MIDAVRMDHVAHADAAVADLDMRFLDAAVIAAGKDQHLVASGDHARDADGAAIGVGGRGGQRPVRQAEAAREFFADPEAVLGGQHHGAAVLQLVGSAARVTASGAWPHMPPVSPSAKST